MQINVKKITIFAKLLTVTVFPRCFTHLFSKKIREVMAVCKA